MTAQRDPVSVLLDHGASVLLGRVYDVPRNTWVGTRLADPGPRARVYLASIGIEWSGPDNPSVPGRRGGLNARDRWTRGFVRALYYQHTRNTKEGMRRMTLNRADALEIDIGRRVVPRGIIPAGRAVRIRIRQGGRAAYQAARKLDDSDRVFLDDGAPGPRAAQLELRDW